MFISIFIIYPAFCNVFAIHLFYSRSVCYLFVYLFIAVIYSSSKELFDIADWISSVWKHVNKIIESFHSAEQTIGNIPYVNIAIAKFTLHLFFFNEEPFTVDVALILT